MRMRPRKFAAMDRISGAAVGASVGAALLKPLSASTRAALCVCLGAALSGCVIGYGHCLWLQPFKQSLTGVLHFRDYPAADGIDHVPVLALDRTAYVYTPAVSHLCLSADDLQLVGWSEFPPDLPENSRVRVDGSLFQASSGHQHTQFLINVSTIVPTAPLAPAAPGAPPTAK